MNNTVESIGLRVQSATPGSKESSVNVHSDIKVEFNSEVDVATFNKNIVVLEDLNGIYKGVSSLSDYSKYGVVKGTASYADKTLTFTPASPLKENCCYIIMLNDGITSITGNKLVSKFISCFYTEVTASFPKCKITSPKYGLITPDVPTFVWTNVGANSYIFQSSKINTFEVLLCDEVVIGNQVTDSIEYTPALNKFPNEGVYFFRVKAENGAWSDVHQIFVKPITDAVIAHEDTPEMMSFKDFLDGIEDEIEILEMFPEPNSIGNSLKTNIVYVKVKGKLPDDPLYINDCWVCGISADDEHEEYGHGELPGSWTIVYDDFYDVSYVIFNPFDVEDEEEESQQEEENTEPETPEEPENTETGDDNTGEQGGEGEENGNTETNENENQENNPQGDDNQGENTNTEEPTGDDDNGTTEDNTDTESNGDDDNNEGTGDNTETPGDESGD